MTEEKIQDELKAIKEAHAADEGNFFYLMFSCLVTLAFLLEKTTKCLVFLKLKVYLFRFILSGSYNLYFVYLSVEDLQFYCIDDLLLDIRLLL